MAKVHNIPFVLASFGSLVLSYVTTASGGAASPGLEGQRTPRGKGKFFGKKKQHFFDPENVTCLTIQLTSEVLYR